MTTKKPLESDIQALIRKHISEKQLGTIFRANVGQLWTGSKVSLREIVFTANKIGIATAEIKYGKILLTNIRTMKTGLPVGFSDLFGFSTAGVPCFIEVKRDSKEKPTAEQVSFLNTMRERGANAGVAWDCEGAEKIILGGRK